MADNDAPQGDKALLAQTPEVEIAGKTYQMRRLGLPQSCQLARIFEAGKATCSVDLVAVAKSQDVGQAIGASVSLCMAAMGNAERDVMSFLAYCLGVDVGEIRDPELFPMSSLVPIFRALWEHPDLQSFFAQASALLMPTETSTPDSSEPSTS